MNGAWFTMIHVIYGLAVCISVFWAGNWIVHFLALFHAKWKLHRKVSKSVVEDGLPGVSILKPLSGDDPNLYQNVETFFLQSYPLYELLFCVEDKSDPCLPVVQGLMEKYSQVDASLFIGGETVGVNPKINNMHPGYKAAKYDLIMISDSGIRVRDDTLLEMVSQMAEQIAIVHQMPFTCDREGFPATLEKIYFGTWIARIYLSADLLGINCHTGMSTLIRKSILEEAGGLRAFGVYIAEDFFIAQYVHDRGFKMRVSSLPALQNSGICRIVLFRERLARWAKLRLAMVPVAFALELLSGSIVSGFCASWAAHKLFDLDYTIFFLLHMLAWFLLDWLLLTIVQHGSLPFNKVEFLIGWILSEVTWPAMTVRSLWDPAVRWRSRTFRLRWGGIAEELKPKIKL